MLPKKWIIGVISVLMATLLFGGYMAIAAELGGKDDPLVTLSYIQELMPELQNSISAAVAEKTAEFDAALALKVDEVNQSIDDKISRFEEQYAAGYANDAFVNKVADAVIDKAGGTGFIGNSTPVTTAPPEETDSPSTGNSSLFQTVRFSAGTVVYGTVGTEILWRIGTATCVADGSPGIIDVTTGEDLAAGGQLRQNHHYVISMAEGRGFKCTSNVVILIKGPYTVG